MVKIHMLGGAGSGKTTLAQSVSSRFQIPHYDLDQMTMNINQLDLEDRARHAAYIEKAFALAEQPGWVTEGIFLVWTEPLLAHADYIVVLDVSWPVAAWRILARHVAKSLRGTNPYPTKVLFPFLKNVRDYYVNRDRSAPLTEEFMREYLEKDEASSELVDAERLLMQMDKYGKFSLFYTADFLMKYLVRYKEKIFIVKNHADRERLFELLTNM
jgi:adenylate kinase family enzyme